jgi:ketosteroid isomerase-like protein
MDLEALTREYFAAMQDVQVDRILALFDERGQYEVRGTVGPVSKDGYRQYLEQVRARLPRIAFTIEDLTVKRNIVFVQWSAVGETNDAKPVHYHGVHVLSWNQKGLVAHVTSLIEPSTLQRLMGPSF